MPVFPVGRALAMGAAAIDPTVLLVRLLKAAVRPRLGTGIARESQGRRHGAS